MFRNLKFVVAAIAIVAAAAVVGVVGARDTLFDDGPPSNAQHVNPDHPRDEGGVSTVLPNGDRITTGDLEIHPIPDPSPENQ